MLANGLRIARQWRTLRFAWNHLSHLELLEGRPFACVPRVSWHEMRLVFCTAVVHMAAVGRVYKLTLAAGSRPAAHRPSACLQPCESWEQCARAGSSTLIQLHHTRRARDTRPPARGLGCARARTAATARVNLHVVSAFSASWSFVAEARAHTRARFTQKSILQTQASKRACDIDNTDPTGWPLACHWLATSLVSRASAPTSEPSPPPPPPPPPLPLPLATRRVEVGPAFE